MTLHLIAIALTSAASPALAETVCCADANGEVMVAYDIDWDDGTARATRVEMQIADDFGISTDPVHEDYSGEDIAEQTVTGTFTEIVLRVSGRPPALLLRLAEGDHGDIRLRAGVLSVTGGGVWVVSCNTPV